MINFNTKMSYHRHNHKQSSTEPKDEYAIIRCFESDRGRILNSAAIRRLQQKTQVFPLERNAVVRTRLTHSLEVQQVGRHIVKEVFHRLANDHKLEQYGLTAWMTPIESVIEMACLMHDIGNPPFGHFGESAINQWFMARFSIDKASHYAVLAFADQDGSPAQDALRKKIRHDLCHFEGNAQAIRLVHSLLKLNLTYSQTACILKYTRPAYWYEAIPDSYHYLMKKPGYYLSEEAFVTELYQQLEMQPFHRFPLTYIMEAADDISYCIADLEDAVEKRILSVEQLYQYLQEAWGQQTSGDLFEQTVNKAYKVYNELKRNELLPTGIDQFFMLLRVNTIGQLVPHAAERFLENIDDIYHGSFNQALLEDRGSEYQLLNMFKTVGFKYVFNHESVENIELQGYRIICGLLDIYSPLLDMSTADFIQLVDENSHKRYPIETRLFHKLSAKHCVAYRQSIDEYQQSADFAIWEFYYRCRLIQDYISGMTDHFAYDEYRRFMVAD
ncbi:dGTPase [Utexia brackfieldae]|uniref:dGTPase n=1 Tax=Utexia brackfieldae TaxID=3074108 RepID=UPI00370D0311